MNSIRTSLTVPLVLGIALLCAVVTAVQYASVRGALIRQFDDALHAKATALGSLVMQRRDGHLEFDYSDDNFAEFRRDDRPEYFRVRRADGSTLERSKTLDATAEPAAALGDDEPKPRRGLRTR